jgi:hypothetical protein
LHDIRSKLPETLLFQRQFIIDHNVSSEGLTFLYSYTVADSV